MNLQSSSAVLTYLVIQNLSQEVKIFHFVATRSQQIKNILRISVDKRTNFTMISGIIKLSLIFSFVCSCLPSNGLFCRAFSLRPIKRSKSLYFRLNNITYIFLKTSNIQNCLQLLLISF